MRNKFIGFFCFFFLFFISNAFCGPFGLDFGMSYEQVCIISMMKPIYMENDYYFIFPPNTNEQFEACVVRIHPKYGIYLITSYGKDINSNAQGTALRTHFNDLVSSIEKNYGKYKKEDFTVQGSF
jgi:hypothetical protein